MQKFLLALPLGLLASGCAVVINTGMDGSGHAVSESRPVSSVHQIEQSGSVDVEVSIGDTPSLSVYGDDNLISHVHTEQSGDSLRIWTDGWYSTHNRLQVKLVTPNLNSLANNGSGDVTVLGLNGGALRLNSNGSGNIRLNGSIDSLNANVHGSGDLLASRLAARNIDLELVGSGDAKLNATGALNFAATLRGSGSVTAAGQAKVLHGEVRGSGDLRLAQLLTEDADLELSGSGSISAFASHSVRVRSHGSGDVVVHGNPAQSDVEGKSIHVGA
jgi:hypothetical protein